MTVYIHGSSGVGKSALVRHFLQQLQAREEVVVLAGHCYERESVPYKALDGVVDSLSKYLRSLPQPRPFFVVRRVASNRGGKAEPRFSPPIL